MQVMLLSVIISTIFLIRCSTIDVPNAEVCRDKGPLGAHCAFTNHGDSHDIVLHDWDLQRFGYFCMSEVDFAATQKFIEQACEKHQDCNIVVVRKLFQEFKNRMKSVDDEDSEVVYNAR